MKPNKETIIRTVITFIALLNSVLVMCNKNGFTDGRCWVGCTKADVADDF